MQTDIQELISGKGFIMVNKGLAKAIGLVPATIYGELVSTFLYWKERGQLTENEGKEWFFCTIEDLEDKTTVKKDSQNKAIKALEKEGLIITKRFGLPAKRYFHITDRYIEILFENYFSQKPKTDDSKVSDDENSHKARSNQISEKPKTTIRKNRKQDFGKTDTNNKALNNKIFNNSLRERELKDNIDIPVFNDSELVEFLEEQIPAFQDKNIDVQKVISWLEVNQEVYTYRELAVGLKQLLEYPEQIEKPINFLNSTFAKIEDYVKAHDKKYMKKTDKQMAEMNQHQELSQAYQQKVPFYNWLEERD